MAICYGSYPITINVKTKIHRRQQWHDMNPVRELNQDILINPELSHPYDEELDQLVHLNICSRQYNQMAFSGQKSNVRIKV